jgi:hypothetical protein
MVAAVLGVGKAVGPQRVTPGPAMARIVTSAYRYKRPPRRKKSVALEGPKVVRRRVSEVTPPANPTPVTPANEARKSAIITARKAGEAIRLRVRSDGGRAPAATRCSRCDNAGLQAPDCHQATAGWRRMSHSAHRAGNWRE